MPQHDDRLHETLIELERQLERAGEVDPEERALLQRVMGEIRETLQREEPARPTAEEHASLAERLRDAARRFEAKHPVLVEPLNRVMDALAALGI